jgi:hypothetical protein
MSERELLMDDGEEGNVDRGTMVHVGDVQPGKMLEDVKVAEEAGSSMGDGVGETE